MSFVDSPSTFDILASPQAYQNSFFSQPVLSNGVSPVPSTYSTPYQSPTPTPSGNDFFSSIVGGVGGALTQVVPQFTTALLQAGGQKFINDTFKGGTKTPTTAQTQSNSSIFTNPTTWLIVGGVAVVAVLGFLALKD